MAEFVVLLAERERVCPGDLGSVVAEESDGVVVVAVAVDERLAEEIL